MTGSALCFALMTGVIRHVSGELHPFEIAFFRSLFGLLFMLPWVARTGLGALGTRRLVLYVLRGLVSVVSLILWMLAVASLPIVDATALFFTSSLFATVLAVAVVGELVGARRWAATLLGFAGAVVILRPGAEALSPPALFALASAALAGGSITIVKLLARTEPPNAIVTYMTLMLTPLSLIPALFVWRTPDLATLGWLAVLGSVGSIGHMALARAMRAADSSAMMPFGYAQLPFAAILGWLAFAEVPTAWTWAGAALILLPTLYVARREARAAGAGSAPRAGRARR